MKLLEKVKMDLITDSRDQYKKAVLSLLERDEAAVVLDLGCGNSKRLTRRVIKTVGAVGAFGVDLKGYDEEGLSVVASDLNDGIPFPADRFDVVVASQIIEHLRNTDGFLKEIKRVLKPTGYAVISTPNLAAWHNILHLLLGKQPPVATVSDDMFPENEAHGHLRVFTKSELIKLLRFHGFRIEKVAGTSSFFGRPSIVTVKVRR